MPDFDSLPTERPLWLMAVEDALLDAAAEGWIVEDVITFHWAGAEDASWSLDPEDL